MTALNKYSANAGGLMSPLTRAEEVAPHNTNELVNVSRSLWIGTAGDLKITTVDGSTVTLVNVPAGTMLPIRAKVVFLTGTTADDIVAFD